MEVAAEDKGGPLRAACCAYSNLCSWCCSRRCACCRCVPPLPAAQWRSNSVLTAAAVNASECSSCALPPAPCLGRRCLGSARGVTAGGFQSASAASEALPQAATWRVRARRAQVGGQELGCARPQDRGGGSLERHGPGREVLQWGEARSDAAAHPPALRSRPAQLHPRSVLSWRRVAGPPPRAGAHQHLLGQVPLLLVAAGAAQLLAELLQRVRGHHRQRGKHVGGRGAAWRTRREHQHVVEGSGRSSSAAGQPGLPSAGMQAGCREGSCVGLKGGRARVVGA